MSNYKKAISEMKWSYSRLSAFEHCKYSFYLNYIVADNDEYLSEGNYFAEVGSFVHEILEKIFKGEMSPDDAPSYYVEHFDENVCYKARESTMAKTFESCADYFSMADFSWLKDYEILGVEKEVKFKIDNREFVGYIDLLLRDKRDNHIVVMDNKSSAYPFKKDGKVKANAKETLEKYKRQLYLYSFAIEQEYGEFPKTLMWNHFKDGGQLAVIPFCSDEYEATINWAINIINQIENEEEYLSVIEELEASPQLNKEYWYCNNLCNFRHSCEYNATTDWSSI